MKTKIVLGLGLVLAICLAVVPAVVHSASSAPANGCFVGGLQDWVMLGNASYQIAGHGSCGAAKLHYWGGNGQVLSEPFVTLNGQLTFWEKSMANGGTLTVYVKNWYSYVVTQIYNASASADWTSHTVAVGGDGTQKLSVWFQVTGGDTVTDIAVSDISLDNGSNTPANIPQYINGDFSSNLRNWTDLYGGWSADATTGHTSPPDATTNNNPYDNRNTIGSIPFILTTGQTSWTVWSKSRNGLYGYVQALDGSGTWTQILNDATTCSDWCSNSFSLSSYLGSIVVLKFNEQGGWGNLYLDDICPAGGCLGWTNPPTPTPSPTVPLTATPIATWVGGGNFPYGPGTPIPIDWSKFPTVPPYPTFPPFATQLPYPTPLYGLGTPQPITGSVTISGTVKIDDRTPVRVKVDDSTPVAVKVDDRTPVRVMFGNGPNYTAVPWQNAGGEQRAPAAGAVLPTMISSPSQSHIEYGQGGSSANPLNFHLQQVDYYFGGVGVQPLGLSFNLLIHYYYPDAFSLAGIDILPGIYGLAAVYVLVTIIRQLQAR